MVALGNFIFPPFMPAVSLFLENLTNIFFFLKIYEWEICHQNSCNNCPATIFIHYSLFILILDVGCEKVISDLGLAVFFRWILQVPQPPNLASQNLA